MSLLIEQHRRRWGRQPQAPQPLDRNGPYADGLLFHAPMHPSWGMRDLVSGRAATKTGLATSAITVAGVLPLFGASNYADFAAPAAFDGSLPFTIAWLQQPISPTGYSTVLDVRPPVNSANSFLIYQAAADTTYQFVVGLRDGGGAAHQARFMMGLQTSGLLDVYVLVVPAGYATTTSGYVLYRNGMRQAAAVNNAAFAVATQTGFRIGCVLGTPGDPFEGALGGVTIWQRSLNHAEASAWAPERMLAPRRTRRYVPLAGGSSAFSITLTAATAATAAIRKAAASSKAATATTTPLLQRSISAKRSASTAVSGALATIKAKLLTLSASVTTSASVQRATAATRAATSATSAGLAKAAKAVRAAAATAAGVVLKRAVLLRSVSTAVAGLVATTKAKLLTLVATAATSAQVTKLARVTRSATSSLSALITRLFTPGSGGPGLFIPALRRLISASRGVLFTSPDRSVDLESPDRTNTLTSPRRDDT